MPKGGEKESESRERFDYRGGGVVRMGPGKGRVATGGKEKKWGDITAKPILGGEKLKDRRKDSLGRNHEKGTVRR